MSTGDMFCTKCGKYLATHGTSCSQELTAIPQTFNIISDLDKLKIELADSTLPILEILHKQGNWILAPENIMELINQIKQLEAGNG